MWIMSRRDGHVFRWRGGRETRSTPNSPIVVGGWKRPSGNRSASGSRRRAVSFSWQLNYVSREAEGGDRMRRELRAYRRVVSCTRTTCRADAAHHCTSDHRETTTKGTASARNSAPRGGRVSHDLELRLVERNRCAAKSRASDDDGASPDSVAPRAGDVVRTLEPLSLSAADLHHKFTPRAPMINSQTPTRHNMTPTATAMRRTFFGPTVVVGISCSGCIASSTWLLT